MLTVAYFCIATELRFINNNDNKSEYWHYKAVEISCQFLPNSCPIIKHYISSYYKHYAANLRVIVSIYLTEIF